MNDQFRDGTDLDGYGAPPFPSEDSIRVLVAASRPLVLGALSDLVESLRPVVALVGQAGSYARALELARTLRPRVVLLGVAGEPMELPDTVRALTELEGTRVVLLMGRNDTVGAEHLLRLQAAGVLIAQEPTEAIVHAILGAHGGQGVRAERRDPPHREPAEPAVRRRRDAVSSLTLRERQLIAVIVAHPSAKYLAIADRMGISEHTVHNHLTHIYQKLHVVNRSDLLVYAVSRGLGGNLHRPAPDRH
jgi:two-component system, NarL family, response regulator LiaR